MTQPPTYMPHEVFLAGVRQGQEPPRVFISPQRYVQGEGVLDAFGDYLQLVGARRPGLLISRRGERNEGKRLLASLSERGMSASVSSFRGECSLEEIDHHVEAFAGTDIDCLIAVGGGKCLDAGKGIAYRLGIPVVIVPSLASNDAPCSALSVLYTPAGVSAGPEFYPQSPSLVVVDTEVIAAAPARYLVAGIGDAMATWYEAQCAAHPGGVNTLGARPTIAAAAIGQACAQTLFDQGVAAARAVARSELTAELDQVIEANTLLSGLGFESGGLAAAHGFAQAFTALPDVEGNHLHGEMVAIGTLGQLMLEGREDEARRVGDFFADVGLPVHLAQLSLDAKDAAAIDTVVEDTLTFPFIGNMPVEISDTSVRAALLAVDELGRDVSGSRGDAAYRELHR